MLATEQPRRCLRQPAVENVLGWHRRACQAFGASEAVWALVRIAPGVDGVNLDRRLQDAIRELLLCRRTGDDEYRVWAGLGGPLIRILLAAYCVQCVQQRDPSGTRLVGRQVHRDKRRGGWQFCEAQFSDGLSTEFDVTAPPADHPPRR